MTKINLEEILMADELDPKQKHIQLSWELIGYKLMYYFPELVHESWHKTLDIPDSEYDEKEREYLRLCLELGYKNTVAGQTSVDGKEVDGEGMTELDTSRPSVSLAKHKYSRRRIH
jgi:hypothetical protein